MTKFGSNSIKVLMDNADTGHSATDITAYVTKLGDIVVNKGLVDITPFGTSSAAFLQGVFKTYEPIEIAGFYDDAATTGPDAIFNIGRYTHAVARTLRIELGTRYISGECWITAYTRGDEVGGYVTYSATVQLTGTVTEGTV